MSLTVCVSMVPESKNLNSCLGIGSIFVLSLLSLDNVIYDDEIRVKRPRLSYDHVQYQQEHYASNYPIGKDLQLILRVQEQRIWRSP